MLGNLKQTKTLKKVELSCKRKKIKLSYYQCASSQRIIVEARGIINTICLIINRDGSLTK